jgi:hypothetical protein
MQRVASCACGESSMSQSVNLKFDGDLVSIDIKLRPLSNAIDATEAQTLSQHNSRHADRPQHPRHRSRRTLALSSRLCSIHEEAEKKKERDVPRKPQASHKSQGPRDLIGLTRAEAARRPTPTHQQRTVVGCVGYASSVCLRAACRPYATARNEGRRAGLAAKKRPSFFFRSGHGP